MPRRPKNVSAGDREAALKLGQNISAVAQKLLRTRGMTQMNLADATGYARSSISQLLNSENAERNWRLKPLCAVSRALEIPISQLIQMAEAWDDSQQDKDALEVSIQVFGTEPRTADRLQTLINGALNSNTNTEDVMLFEIGCPAFYKSFIKGITTDLEAWDKLKEAAALRETYIPGTTLPLWAVIAKTFK